MNRIVVAAVLVTALSCLSQNKTEVTVDTQDSIKVDSLKLSLDSLKQAELDSLGEGYIFEND